MRVATTEANTSISAPIVSYPVTENEITTGALTVRPGNVWRAQLTISVSGGSGAFETPSSIWLMLTLVRDVDVLSLRAVWTFALSSPLPTIPLPESEATTLVWSNCQELWMRR